MPRKPITETNQAKQVIDQSPNSQKIEQKLQKLKPLTNFNKQTLEANRTTNPKSKTLTPKRNAQN